MGTLRLDLNKKGPLHDKQRVQRSRRPAQSAAKTPKKSKEKGVLVGEGTWRQPQPESWEPSSTPLDPLPLPLELLLLFELSLVLSFVLLLVVHSGAGQASASGASAT